MLVPTVVPAVPAPRSPAALLLLAIGLCRCTAPSAVRAASTFLLTRRAADLAVVVGLALPRGSLYGALMLTFMDLGWWLGHLFEFVGIALVGASVGYDLRRGRRSRAARRRPARREIVASEEAFLGARVRALMLRLAAKDASTEEHTRRVATLAVEIGEQLGLSPARLRSLAIGGLLHDIGKLSVPVSILQKPGRSTTRSSTRSSSTPSTAASSSRARRLRRARPPAGARPPRAARRRRLSARPGRGQLDLETRILSVCDVYDALVSPRVYRGAWTREQALALLREESGKAFDRRCVAALERLVAQPVAVRTLRVAAVMPAVSR